MNSIDVYVDSQRLDLFKDEIIQYNALVQQLTDLDKIFTDFSQSFTIPASSVNDSIFGYFYREDILSGGFDGRIYHTARIEINGLLFREGVVRVEAVEVSNNDPYSYTIGFFAGVVNLNDLFGEDYLYDLDMTAYDHPYTAGAIATRAFSNSTGTDLFYPLCSPVQRWFYNSSVGAGEDNNIAFHAGSGDHGISYYELKPALKCIRILEEIEAKYGVDFTGPFISDARFTLLYMWLHRKEGYMYENQISAQTYSVVPFDFGTGTFDAATDTHTATADDYFQFDINVTTLVGTANFAAYVNGGYRDSVVATGTGVISINNVWMNTGDTMQLRVKSNDNISPLSYRVGNMDCISVGYATTTGTAQQVFSRTISSEVRVTELMPEMKVKDFVSGLFRMFNLVCIPTNTTTFYLENIEDWHDAGTEKDITEFVDVDTITKEPVPIYEEIDFSYSKSNQILNYEYGNTQPAEWGQLKSKFAVNRKEEFKIDLPFEMPFFERLTDQNTGGSGLGLTSVYIYNSINRNQNADGTFQPYIGKPVLMYGKFSHSMTGFPVGFVDAGGVALGYSQAWWAAECTTDINPADAKALNFGGDINPYFRVSIGDSLYNEHWREYIEPLYDIRRRVVKLKARYDLLNVMKFELNDILIWQQNKYRIIDAAFNLATNEVDLTLINILGEPLAAIPAPVIPFCEALWEEEPTDWAEIGGSWDCSIGFLDETPVRSE